MPEKRGLDRLGIAAAAASSIAFVAISAGYYGYNFGQSANQAFYLPWVLSHLNPSLFAGDPAVAAVAGVPTYFWRLLAASAGVIGLERAAGLLWLLTRAVAGLATYKTARLLGGTRAAGALSVLLTAVSWEIFAFSPLAGDPMLKTFLDQTSFSWPLILCVIAAWLSGRRVAALLSLGLIANLNVLLAISVACWLILGAILERTARLKEFALGTALFLAAASPVLIHAVRGGLRGDIGLMLACSPQTYLCSVWPWEKWLGAAVQLAFWTVMFAQHPRARRLAPLLFSALILWTATALAGLTPAFQQFLSLQFFRLDVAVCWLALAVSGSVLAHRLGDPRPARFMPAAAAAWGLACPAGGMVLTAWATGLVLSKSSRGARICMGLAGIFYGLLALNRPAGSLLHLPFSAALATLLWGGLLVAFERAPALSARAHAAVLALAAALIIQPLAAVSRARFGRSDEPSLDAAQSWARGTPVDALFIAPPDWSGFRLGAQRPVYAEWTDFNLANWDAPAALAWKERMGELGVDWEGLAARRAISARLMEASLARRSGVPRPADLREWTADDAARLAALARRAHAGYLAAPASLRLPWAQAFRSDRTVVYVPPH